MPPPDTREIWLRGPLPDVPALVQPVAHALLQAREEVYALLQDFPENLLWVRPLDRNNVALASVGFHLQHLTGVLDRLFTYARGEELSPDQLTSLAAEGKPTEPLPSTQELIARFDRQVDLALIQLRITDEQTLTEVRGGWAGTTTLNDNWLAGSFSRAHHASCGPIIGNGAADNRLTFF